MENFKKENTSSPFYREIKSSRLIQNYDVIVSNQFSSNFSHLHLLCFHHPIFHNKTTGTSQNMEYKILLLKYNSLAK